MQFIHYTFSTKCVILKSYVVVKYENDFYKAIYKNKNYQKKNTGF